MGRRLAEKPERLFPDAAAAWLPDATPDPLLPLELVWWFSHRAPLVLMAARRHWTRAWRSYVVLPQEG